MPARTKSKGLSLKAVVEQIVAYLRKSSSILQPLSHNVDCLRNDIDGLRETIRAEKETQDEIKTYLLPLSQVYNGLLVNNVRLREEIQKLTQECKHWQEMYVGANQARHALAAKVSSQPPEQPPEQPRPSG
jgi:outer membrane murein-binding lipoprotein Lpp